MVVVRRISFSRLLAVMGLKYAMFLLIASVAQTESRNGFMDMIGSTMNRGWMAKMILWNYYWLWLSVVYIIVEKL